MIIVFFYSSSDRRHWKKMWIFELYLELQIAVKFLKKLRNKYKFFSISNKKEVSHKNKKKTNKTNTQQIMKTFLLNKRKEIYRFHIIFVVVSCNGNSDAQKYPKWISENGSIFKQEKNLCEFHHIFLSWSGRRRWLKKASF